MKIYLAASMDRRDEIQRLATILTEERVFEIGSHWHSETWTDADAGVRCVRDLKACDALVLFTNPKGWTNTGGKDVEFGIALAMRKPITIVGPRVNVFHLHPSLSYFETVEDFMVECCKRGVKR